MSTPPLLDLSRLRDALGDEPELIAEILTMYRDTASVDMANLERAVAGGVAEQVVRSAHALKGASGNVGADRMMALSAEIEKLARAGDLGRAPALFLNLQQTFRDTLSAFPSA